MAELKQQLQTAEAEDAQAEREIELHKRKALRECEQLKWAAIREVGIRRMDPVLLPFFAHISALFLSMARNSSYSPRRQLQSSLLFLLSHRLRLNPTTVLNRLLRQELHCNML